MSGDPIGPTIWGDPLFANGFDRLEPSNRLYSAPLGKNFRMNVEAVSVDYRFAKCQFCIDVPVKYPTPLRLHLYQPKLVCPSLLKEWLAAESDKDAARGFVCSRSSKGQEKAIDGVLGSRE